MVSQIDDDISPQEELLLQNLIKDNRQLTNIEKDSLLAFLHWCLRTPQKTTGLKPIISNLHENEKMGIRNILLDIAQADGVIQPEEIKKLEQLYTTLGLDKTRVVSDIHSMVIDDQHVTVDVKDQGGTYAIPLADPGAAQEEEFSLNQSLIEKLEKDTERVKATIAEIFNQQDEEFLEEAEAGEVPPLDESSDSRIEVSEITLGTIDRKYRAKKRSQH